MSNLSWSERKALEDEARTELLEQDDEFLVSFTKESSLELIQNIRTTYLGAIKVDKAYTLSVRQRWCLANWLAEKQVREENE